MLKALDTIGRFLRAVVALTALGLVTVAGWMGYNSYNKDRLALEDVQKKLTERDVEIKGLRGDIKERDEQIGKLDEEVKAKQKQIERLDTSLRLLKVDQRVARLEVLGQTGSAEKGDLVTRFSFVELDAAGKPLGAPRVLSIKGDLVYLDAWVIKFQDELIESGNAEHEASIFVFRRIFGEAQQPKEGFVLDPVGSSPERYRFGKPESASDKELWTRFWDYANDAKLADSRGIRAAHGEAPSIKLLPGMKYKVYLRSSGGLSIKPEDPNETRKTGPA